MSFSTNKNDEVSNIYRSIIDWPKIKHLRCQQLLCSTRPCPNKRPDINNLIVKVTYYDNVGNPIIGFYNIMVKLKLIISFIDNKIYNQTNLFFLKTARRVLWWIILIVSKKRYSIIIRRFAKQLNKYGKSFFSKK